MHHLSRFMTSIDIIVIVAYLAAMLGLGYYVGRGNKTSEDYFAGSRNMPWYAIGFSVGATFISASTFIGGPGWAYYDGIVAAMINFGVPLGVIYANYFIHPIFYYHKITTIYEYQYKRFGTLTRLFCSGTWILSNIFTVGAVVYIPCLAMEAMTGIDFNVWIPIVVVMSIIYTIAGGIKAVIWSDMIQGIILIVGVIVCLWVGIDELGMPISQLMDTSRDAGLLQSFDYSINLVDLTFWCALLAGAYTWGDYFASDQTQIQRYITAKDARTIKKSNILAIIAIQLIYWAAHFMGVVLHHFYQSNPATLDFENTNNIMIDFMLNYMPLGFRGLLIAAIFAAAMSTLDSKLNSFSAVFVKDVYEPYISKKSNTPNRVNIYVSLAVGVVVTAFVYFYLGETSSSILLVAGNLLAPFAGMSTAIAISCFYFPRINDKAMFWGSIASAAVVFWLNSNMNWFYLWTWVITSLISVGFALVLGYTVFKNDNERDRTYKYTFFGARKELKGVTDESGCSMEPLKLDKYFWIMLGLFAVQVIILWAVQ